MELLPNFQTYKSYTLAVITNNSPQATYIYTKTALSSSLEQKLNFVIYKSPAHHLTTIDVHRWVKQHEVYCSATFKHFKVLLFYVTAMDTCTPLHALLIPVAAFCLVNH